MLQGVEILSQEVIGTVKNNYSILIIGVIVSILLGILFYYFINSYICQLILYSGVFISFILMLVFPIHTGEYTQYKVTISDEVNFVEFTEKYEIINQDEKIYTIKERDENIK